MKRHSIRWTAAVCSAVLALGAVQMPYADSLPAIVTAADSVTITEAGGWFETAYCKWTPVDDASGYNVYVKGDSGSYTQIDSMLIRQYNGYYRADAVGLKAGTYTMKVCPIINSSEAAGTETTSISVVANAREGYAFAGNGVGSGGYNDDGTPAAGAQIIYVTDETKDTVTLDVITNSNGATTTCTGLGAIMNARKKGYDTTPLIIRMIGKVTAPSGLNSSGYLEIKTCSNITLEGIGDDAVAYGWGILVRGATDIEIDNIALMLFPDDGVSMDTDNKNIWVHNCDFFYGTAGSDADQAKGDGSCDVKKSTDITVSYNHFWDSGKAILCGLSEPSEFFITYHHNWFDHSDSRHPRVRTGTIHVYNNYYDGNAKYGIGSTEGSSIFSESNYFRNCKYPMLISLQGSDVSNGNDGTFSDEDGGIIKSYGNYIEGAKAYVTYQQDNTEFDAYEASSRSETVPASVKTKVGGTSYNNFDTASDFYSYTPHAAADVPAVVGEYAGRMHGGDFDWTFDNATEDSNYGIISDLMSAIKSYTSPIVAIGSGSYVQPIDPPVTTTTTTDTSTSTTTTTTNHDGGTTPVIPDDGSGYVHNFTASGTSSSFYAISGNLSTSKGTAIYNGLTLTQCLKLETATSISFTAPSDGTLTLVFGEADGNAKLDGTKIDSSNGVLTTQISAGSHTITKADSCNLFYMVYAPSGTTTVTTTTATTTTTNTTTTTTASIAQTVMGDVDCNGICNVSDAVLLARYVAEDANVTVSAQGLINAEFDQNPGLSSADTSALIGYIAGTN